MYHWNANLVHVDVGIWRYDRASCIVYSLSHHVLTE